MLVTKRSATSGKTHTQVIAVTEEQLKAIKAGVRSIQDICPNLTADEREFLMTGTTKEEWDALFTNPDSESN